MPNESGKLSMEELLTQAAGGVPAAAAAPAPAPTPTPTPTPTPVPVSTNPADPIPTDPKTVIPTNPTATDPTPTDPAPTDPKPAESKPNPMKEIRDKYNSEKSAREKIENTLQKFTNGDYSFKLKDFRTEDGKMDYAALDKAMEDADVKAQAVTKGISPEVQAELNRIEKEKVELEKQKLQVSMDRALTNLQIEMGIKGTDINNFFKDAMAVKKNPYQWLAQGGELQDLYHLVYKDKLIKTQIDTAIAAARTKWEAEAKVQTKVPTHNPATATPQASVNPTGLSMEQILTEAAKKRTR